MYNKQTWLDEIPDMTKPIYDASGKQKTDPQTGRPLFELVQAGTRITSSRLNTMEGGIEAAHTLVEQLAKELGGNFVVPIDGTMGLLCNAQGLKATWTAGIAYVGGRRYQVAAGEMPLNPTQGQYLYVDVGGVVKKTTSQATAKMGLVLFYVATDTSGVISSNDLRVNVSLEEIMNKLKNIDIPNGSLTERGKVQLSDAINSTATDRAATPNAVKMAYDKAIAAQQHKLTADDGRTHSEDFEDANFAFSSGMYFVANATNLPENFDRGIMTNQTGNSGEVVQTVMSTISGRMWVRATDSMGWTPWTELAAENGDFGVTTNSGNKYSLWLNRVPNIVAGTRVTVKINTANTGAATLDVNYFGDVPMKKSSGAALKAGDLKAGSIYTFVYDGTSAFILQGEGGEYGTAVPSQVLAPNTIGTNAGVVVGTMPNNGSLAITPGPSPIPIPAGYTSGGTVAASVPKVGRYVYKPTGVRSISGDTLVYTYSVPIELPPEQGIPLVIKTSRINVNIPAAANAGDRMFVSGSILIFEFTSTQYLSTPIATETYDANANVLYKVTVQASSTSHMQGDPITIAVRCFCSAGSMAAVNSADFRPEFDVWYATV